MKGTPHSLWLSMANRSASQAIGFWSGLFNAAARRNQTALFNAMTKPPKAKRPAQKKKSR
ncbi:hypothetical protein TSH58p_10470 [Azospirillum sp. TSH58]|uniref:hypothetical protein n=1 Tax=Azospirillum sp. TSH58 TaxID=664962 RepID=UPI000D601A20|nr:hypothetical protein [Azospirillum sp. TSH58]AWJ83904.1 hypothetical protein TSH58p_10470 [Azospirillum sp. TSH58]PWC70692.1 hypothetical protein TSH58_12470 [Azospirillum sp. TSH58]